MGNQATGALSRVMLGFETLFGTLATAGFVLPIVSSSLQMSQSKIPSKVIRNNFNPGRPSKGRKNVSGTIVVPVCSISLWYWAKAAFNTLVTTGTGPFAHEFKMTGTTKRGSISIEHGYLDLDTPQYAQYTGGKISSMGFSTGQEGELLCNIGIVGADETFATSSFDSSPTVVGYAPLDEADASIKEGGVSFADSTGVSLDINFNPDTSQYVVGGGGTLGAIPDGIIGVGGRLGFLFKNMDLLNKAKNGTETSLTQTFYRSASSQVEILCPEMEFGQNSPPINGPQGIVCDLPYEAYYDDGAEESSVVLTITNNEEHA